MNQDEHSDLPAFIIVSPKDIAARAYEIYQARGAYEGFDREDWVHAEQELKAMPARNGRLATQQCDVTVLERTGPAAINR